MTSVLRIARRQRLGKSNARLVAAGHSRKIVLKLDRNVRRNLVAAMRKAQRAQPAGDARPEDQDARTARKTVRKAVVLRR